MSPQILLVVAVFLIVGITAAFLLRAGARRRERSDGYESLAEPGAEGMHVADDGEIAPGRAAD